MCLEPVHNHTAAFFLIVTTIVRGGSCHQRATAVLKTGQPNIYTAETPTSTDSKTKHEANCSPATHQTLQQQQGGTGEDSHVHLADWTLCVAVIKKKKKSMLRVALG